MIRLFFIFSIVLLITAFDVTESVWMIQSGQIQFKSEAPLEVIEASSDGLEGAIDIKNRTFVFSIDVLSFIGFNNQLQKTHFNENYMESTRHEKASFIGKIIEKIDLSKDGDYILRAKGKLNIHGIEQERIIKSRVKIENGKMELNSFFTVFLAEHGITIPKIVHQKIAEEIQVSVKAELKTN